MKIEIGESLACSYLRHVERCWLVQANWKVSEHWQRQASEAEVETLFKEMRQRFGRNGGVFKQTTGAAQFLRQGEIDVVGIDQSRAVYAVEAAFHEAGLNYGNTAETDNRVLKKMLRTLLILRAYLPRETALHIYFLSPKVNPVVQEPLERTFEELQEAYPEVDWRLVSNEIFTEQVVQATLDKASAVADTSELFVRSAKLLELTNGGRRASQPIAMPRTGGARPTTDSQEQVQPLVQTLMRTLLVEHPSLLDETDKRNLSDSEYCKTALGLRIGNHALLRRVDDGWMVAGYSRYWKERYGSFHVCSQWWKDHHATNARAMLGLIRGLAQKQTTNPGVAALQQHEQTFRDYLAGAGR